MIQKVFDQDENSGKNKEVVNGGVDKDSIAQRLEEIYKRLEFIDAYSAEARGASILSVSFSYISHKCYGRITDSIVTCFLMSMRL